MNSSIYIVASVVLAAIMHAGATGGPADPLSERIEARYVGRGWFKALRVIVVWVLLLFLAGLTDRWWMPLILAVPGGASLRFAVLNLPGRR